VDVPEPPFAKASCVELAENVNVPESRGEIRVGEP
jgi:hypothetical protein